MWASLEMFSKCYEPSHRLGYCAKNVYKIQKYNYKVIPYFSAFYISSHQKNIFFKLTSLIIIMKSILKLKHYFFVEIKLLFYVLYEIKMCIFHYLLWLTAPLLLLEVCFKNLFLSKVIIRTVLAVRIMNNAEYYPHGSSAHASSRGWSRWKKKKRPV